VNGFLIRKGTLGLEMIGKLIKKGRSLLIIKSVPSAQSLQTDIGFSRSDGLAQAGVPS
jgi:hypothetical protein